MFSMTEHRTVLRDVGADGGMRVRNARKRSGISLRELARRIDVSPGTMSAIETGKTALTVHRLHRIADALDVSAVDILTETIPESDALPGLVPGPDATGSSAQWREFEPLNLDPVLEAAIETFVGTGYHGATMRLVASNARMSVPGVYHHYPSKQHLIVAILDLAMAELHWRVPAARAEGRTPAERFANMVEALALFHTHRRNLAFIGASEMRSLAAPNDARIARQRNQVQYMLDDEVEKALREGDFTTSHPHDAARAVSTMCTSLPQWFRPGGTTSPEQIAAEYAQFALDMMRGKASTQ
jgi:AcrR family transcriptional regulator/DNA-binding XRE family transcriptional regulator